MTQPVPIATPSAAPPARPPETPRGTFLPDLTIAAVLAILLSIGWAINDWHRLQYITLPDADDMMRLAQVRDWLNGQAFNDWTQYRMAAPHGAPMHWSRINDFGIAGIILAATPLVGRHSAELIAVLTYPGILFILSLFLSARIARRMWSAEAAFVAMVIAALAFPGDRLFEPGRIDHHALQTVVIELAVLAMVRRASLASGLEAGLALAISLVIGLETAPHVAVLIAVMGLIWAWRGAEERVRLAGFAGGIALGTLVCLTFLRPSYWSAAVCDAFTPASSSAALAVSAALAIMALATPFLRDWRLRLGAGVVLGGAALGATLVAFPACLAGPYGVMSPFLQREFLTHIDEANGLFKQVFVSRRIAIGGMMAAGVAASVWMLWRRPRDWPLLAPAAAIVIVSGVITLFQIRGTYIGTPLSAPILAGLVLAARARTTWRVPALLGAWLVSAGVVYGMAPAIEVLATMTPAQRRAVPDVGICQNGDVWQQVDRYPGGIILSPTNMASYTIGATHMATVGAGYHRNDAANVDMYRYFLRTPEQGRPIAAKWRATYVMFCPDDFGEMDAFRRFPNSLATRLQYNRPPPWLERLPLHGASLRLYRIKRY
jgi:hypothetical protein